MEWTAEQLIAHLQLQPLPGEGGYFRETYRAPQRVVANFASESTPHKQNSETIIERDRVAATAIYYLLTPDTYSAWHRLQADEIYHFYAGDPVTLYIIDFSGKLRTVVLGPQFWQDQQFQFVVPAGFWQASQLQAAGRWALLGTTVSPGFEFTDCQLADRALIQTYPELKTQIESLLPVQNKN